MRARNRATLGPTYLNRPWRCEGIGLYEPRHLSPLKQNR